MKNWLGKFRISNSLDSRGQQRGLSSAPANDADLWEFRARMIGLESELRKTPPWQADVPPMLHASVMARVRELKPSLQPAEGVLVWRLAAGLTAAVIVAVVLLIWTPQPPVQNSSRYSEQALAAANTTVETANRLPVSAPGMLAAPLSAELAGLNQDVQRTAQYMLANIP